MDFEARYFPPSSRSGNGCESRSPSSPQLKAWFAYDKEGAEIFYIQEGNLWNGHGASA
jgi:hypothetical protein